MKREIQYEIRSMIKKVNKYEQTMIYELIAKNINLNQILENAQKSKEYGQKFTQSLETSKFTLVDAYYTKISNKLKNINVCLTKITKCERIDLEMMEREIENKIEIGEKELGDKLHKLINMKTKEERIIKDIEYKKEKVPKRIESKNLEELITTSSQYPKGEIIFWDKEYNKNSEQKGGYRRLVELAKGRLAGGREDGLIDILSIKTREKLFTMRGNKRGITFMISIPGAAPKTQIIVGGGDGKIGLWEIADKGGAKCLQSLKIQTSEIVCGIIHNTSGYLITGGYESRARIWDIRRGHIVGQIPHGDKHNTWVTDILELPNGYLLSLCRDRSRQLALKLWFLGEKAPTTLTDIPPHAEEEEGFMSGMLISESRVLLGGCRGHFMEFYVQTLQVHPLILGLHRGGVSHIRQISSYIYITASHDCTLKVVNINTKVVLRTLFGHTAALSGVLPIFTLQ